MDFLKSLGPSLAGFVAGAVVAYFAIKQVNDDRLAAHLSAVQEARQSNNEYKARTEELQQLLARERQTVAQRDQQLTGMIGKESYETVAKQLRDANSRVDESQNRLQQMQSIPLPLVKEWISFGRNWQPWGSAGPSLLVEDGSSRGGYPRVKLTSSEAGGNMLLSNYGRTSSGHVLPQSEQFRFRGTNIIVFVVDIGPTGAEVLIGSSDAVKRHIEELRPSAQAIRPE